MNPGRHPQLGLATFAADLRTLIDRAGEDDLPGLIGALAAEQARLTAQLCAPRREEPKDRLLSAEQAAKLMHCSEDYLYRNSSKLPFVVRPTPGTVRFSEQGLWKYLKQRTG